MSSRRRLRRPTQEDLAETDLAGADLAGATLRGLDLRGRDLSGARLVDARVIDCDLGGADLSGADLTDAEMEGVDLSGACLVDAVCVRLRAEGLRAPGADLRGADLSGGWFQEADLAGADLSGGRADEARLDGARLDEVRARGWRAHRASLEEAVLRDASLVGADLEEADLRRANLSGADLREAVLVAAWLDGADLSGADLAGARAPRAAMRRANLSGATLSGADLSGAVAAGAHGIAAARLQELGAETRPWWRRLLPARRSAPAAGAPPDVETGGPVPEGALPPEGAGEPPRAGGGEPGGPRPGGRSDRAARGARLVALLIGLATVGWLAARFLEDRPGTVLEVPEPEASEVLPDDPEEALARLDERLAAAGTERDRAGLRIERARLLARLGREAEALAELERAQAGAEGDRDLEVERLRVLALARRTAGDADGEAAALEALLRREDLRAEEVAEAGVALADAYGRMGFPERGAELIAGLRERSAEVPGRAVRLAVEVADRLAARGALPAALAQLEGFPPGSLAAAERVELLAGRGRILEQAGRLDEARDLLQGLVEDAELRPLVRGEDWLALARLQAAAGDLAAARRSLEALLASRPSPRVSAMAMLASARLEVEAGRAEAAVHTLEALLQQPLEDPEIRSAARVELATLLAQRARGADFEALLAELRSEGRPELAVDAMLGRAEQELLAGRAERARELLEAVEGGEGADADQRFAARTRLAQLDRDEGEYDAALRRLRALAEEGGRTPDVQMVLASEVAATLLAAGRVEEAEKTYHDLEERWGSELGEARWLAWTGLARCARERGDLAEARRRYEAVVREAGDAAYVEAALAGLAELADAAGRPDDAVRLWTRLLRTLPASQPSRARVEARLGTLLADLGRLDEARPHLEAAVRELPNGPLRVDVQLRRAELLEEAGALQEALRAYAAIQGDTALDAVVRSEAALGRARVALARGDADQALALVEEWAERVDDPGLVEAWHGLRRDALAAAGREEAGAAPAAPEPGDPWVERLAAADAAARAGDLASAEAAYRELAEEAQDPETRASLVLSIARARQAAGDLAGAREAFEEVLQGWGDRPDLVFEARFGLASLERAAGDPAAALEILRGLRAPDPASEALRVEQLAGTLAELGRLEEARRTWKRLLAAPNLPADTECRALMGLADLEREAGREDAALGLYRRAAARAASPSDAARARIRIASVLVDRGEPDPAFFDMRELARATDDPEVRLEASLLMASIYLEKGRHDQAIHLLSGLDGFALGPDWATAVAQARAAALQAAGRYGDAEAEWRAVLEAFSDSPEVAAQARLGLCEVLGARGDVDEAVALCDAVRDDPEADPFYRARALLDAGRVLIDAGRGAEGERRLRALLEQGDVDAVLVGSARDLLESAGG